MLPYTALNRGSALSHLTLTSSLAMASSKIAVFPEPVGADITKGLSEINRCRCTLCIYRHLVALYKTQTNGFEQISIF